MAVIALPGLPVSFDLDVVTQEIWDQNTAATTVKGGEGSGNFGHAGRLGKKGGSMPKGKNRDFDARKEENKLRFAGKSDVSGRKEPVSEDEIRKIDPRFLDDGVNRDHSQTRNFFLERTGAKKMWFGTSDDFVDSVTGYSPTGYYLQDNLATLRVGMELSSGVIYLGRFFKKPEKGVLGYRFMKALREYADLRGFGITVVNSTIPKYYRRFDWLRESDPSTFVYEPWRTGVSEKGGKGSGFYGHAGRPGKRGGSASKKRGDSEIQAKYRDEISRILPLQPAFSFEDDIEFARVGRVFATAVKDIEKVHGDGKISPVPVYLYNDLKGAGMVLHDDSGKPTEMRFKKSRIDNEAVYHEFGHVIDRSSVLTGTSVRDLMHLIYASGMEKDIVDTCDKFIDAIGKSEGRESDSAFEAKLIVRYFRTYLTKPSEMFARAYSQYIATRANKTNLLKTFHAKERRHNILRGGEQLSVPMYWSEREFEPIARKFDEAFREVGWIRP